MYSLDIEIVREYPLSCKKPAVNWFYILKFVTGNSNAGRIIASSKNSGTYLVGKGRNHFFT